MKKQGLFQGRFQPPTKLHKQIILDQQEENDLVVIQIIEGKKSSKDKIKNPFSFEYRKKLLKLLNINVPVIIKKFDNGYVPLIIKEIEDKYEEIEIHNFYCGSDRVKGYERMVETTDDLTDKQKSRIHIKEIKRKMNSDKNVSQSKIRDQIGENDKERQKLYLPEELKPYTEELIEKYNYQTSVQTEQNNLLYNIMGLE